MDKIYDKNWIRIISKQIDSKHCRNTYILEEKKIIEKYKQMWLNVNV